jgi:demethylmenaquinone methyltransferase/2-methoxy-6-polyprenyl-1,4-benzoquinol methylase
MKEAETAILTKEQVVDIYRKRAKRYDFISNLYRLLGFRVPAYRKMAVKALNLHRGDTVVEIGCGTGLNFSLLREAVGPEGKVIGVDLTDSMLAEARTRVEDEGWSNVELVQTDAAQYQFPTRVDGIISTFAITLVPEFDEVIRNGSMALSPGKRWCVLDFKLPTRRLGRTFVPLAVFLTRPYGVRIEMAERHPWESIDKYLTNTSLTELYMGMAYMAVGERGETGR